MMLKRYEVSNKEWQPKRRVYVYAQAHVKPFEVDFGDDGADVDRPVAEVTTEA